MSRRRQVADDVPLTDPETFERTMAALLKVPRSEIVAAEAARPKRRNGQRKKKGTA